MDGTYQRKSKHFHEYCSAAFKCLVVSRTQRASLYHSLKVYMAYCKDSNLKNIILIIYIRKPMT